MKGTIKVAVIEELVLDVLALKLFSCGGRVLSKLSKINLRGVGVLDDVTDAGRAADKADDVADASRIADRKTDAIEGGLDVTPPSTKPSINQGKDPFSYANFKKGDIKMVNDAANQVGVDRKEFGNFIHEIKKDLGMKANQNFTYQELIELAEEFANMTK